MQQQKQKLELTWIGKDKRPRLEPRVLVEDAAKSHHAATRRRDGKDIFDNMLIHGDNLLALKALEQQFTGKVKCIYIDPPYNTGNAFEHYDDGLEHSIWLGLMRERIAMLHRLLSNTGSIWINLDDAEVHYCKILCDEIFGRENFIGSIIWEKADSPKMDPKFFSTSHDTILVYAKKAEALTINREFSTDIPEHYNKTDDQGRRYYLKPMCVMGGNVSDSLFYPMIAPDGTEVLPYTKGQKSCWRWSKKKVEEESNRIEWVKGRKGWSLYFRIYADGRRGMPIRTIWHHDEVGTNRTSKAEINALFGTATFDTPKPERLIEKVINATTNPGDLVLDSFLGSGTTAAVAHKMGRRWIGVELGDHCYTHCKVRLDKVIDGTDAGGITKAVDWKGGGGYRFYELAPTLIKKDKWGQMIINPEYDAEKLAEAVCKLEGFTYAPSESEYFIHGKSTERDYIYVTTNYLKAEHLRALSELVGSERTLLICCKGFENCGGRGATVLPGSALGDRALPGGMRFPNLTVKKIPKAVLDKCEYGHDDYSLNVKNLPMAAPELEQGELFD